MTQIDMMYCFGVLLSIINDILDMSRIESGRMVIKSEEFSLSKTLEQVNTIINGQCRDKGLSYECHASGKLDEYYIGDDMKIRQVLINILGNAVKFTPNGGKIHVSADRVGEKVRITVSDSGVGIDEARIADLLKNNHYYSTPGTNGESGTGLGLLLCQAQLFRNQSTLEFSNVPTGGSEFSFELPTSE